MAGFQQIWGWLPAAYLFLGGLGSGLFAAAALSYLVGGGSWRKTTLWASWTAVACLAAGLVLLDAEAAHPLRALMLWQSFRSTTSWMAFGAWSLTAALAVFTLFSLSCTPRLSWFLVGRAGVPVGALVVVRRALGAAGIAAALCVMTYTGLLLRSAAGIPFWGSWLLPCLFVVAAMGTGSNAAVLLAMRAGELQRAPRRSRQATGAVVAACAVAEAAILAVFLACALGGGEYAALGSSSAGYRAAAAAATSVVAGEFAPWFWMLAVGCGIAAPAVLASAAAIAGKYRPRILATSCTCAILGEFALRAIILFAGLQADWLASTLVLL